MLPVRAVRPPGPDDLAAAERAVRAVLAPTPVVAAPSLGANVLLKVETLQPTGSFKIRGGLAALAAATPGRRVVTASAGNHGLGLAQAAVLLGRPVTVVVPATASAAKIARLRAFAELPGGDVDLVLHGNDYDAAEAHALALAADGADYVSPYNDRHVIAGQHTLGLELGEQVPGELTVVVPVGGGGLLAGVGLWAAGRPGVRVVGVEAAASRAVSAAVAAGRVVDVPVGPTLADGMAGNVEAGTVTVPLAAEHSHGFTTVTEPELRAAMRHLAFECGLVAEGSGAAAVAAVLAGRAADPRPGARVVALVTGRNVAVPTLLEVLGESASGGTP